MLTSAIYRGALRHRRFEPVHHEFTYNVFMVFLDIDRIPELMRVSRFASHNRFNWASFDDRDHFGDPQTPLRQRLQQDAAAHGIPFPDGPVFLLTNLRYLGYNFNPISFFYCYNREGALEAVMAEVNSTFGETRNYWLSAANGYRCAKEMHVSPFMPMDLEYRFVVPAPGDRLVAHIATHSGERQPFDATLTLDREEWSAPALRRALLRHPWMTAKVIASIHWQALRLYVKRAPFYRHPAPYAK